MKKYSSYKIGHAPKGWFVECIKAEDWRECTGDEHSDYLHPSGNIKSFAGDYGYFPNKMEAQLAADVFAGRWLQYDPVSKTIHRSSKSYLPDGLFEI